MTPGPRHLRAAHEHAHDRDRCPPACGAEPAGAEEHRGGAPRDERDSDTDHQHHRPRGDVDTVGGTFREDEDARDSSEKHKSDTCVGQRFAQAEPVFGHRYHVGVGKVLSVFRGQFVGVAEDIGGGRPGRLGGGDQFGLPGVARLKRDALLRQAQDVARRPPTIPLGPVVQRHHNSYLG